MKSRFGLRLLLALLLQALSLPFALAQELPHYRSLNLPGMRDKAGLLHQDSRGWIYLLNQRQLHRFDGAVWKSFSLPTDTIVFTALCSYDNQIWAGTSKGMLLSTHGDSLLPFELEEGWPKASITALTAKNGILWIATAGEGVYAYKNKRLYLFDADDGLPDLTVSSLEPGKRGMLAGTDLGLVELWFKADGTKQSRILSNEPLIAAIKSEDEGVWMGLQSGGLSLLQQQALVHYPHSDEDAVTHLLVLPEEVWFSDRNGHLWRFLKKSKQYQPLPFTYNGKQIRVYDLLRSADGLVWISTQHGLLQAYPGMGMHPLPLDLQVQAMAMLPNGSLLAGTHAGAYLKKDKRAWKLLAGTQNLHILSLVAETESSWLAGTFGQGFYRLREQGLPQRIGPDAHQFNPNIFSIEPQADGKGYYLGTLGGLYHFHQNAGKDLIAPFHQQQGPGQYYIFQLAHDQQGRLWMATDGKGVFSYHQGQFQQFNKLPQGQLRVASSLSADSSNRLWISSPEQGLFLMENQQLRSVPLNTDEPISFVHSLNRRQLLLGLQHGLLLYDSETKSALPIERLYNLPVTELSTNAYAQGAYGVWIGMRGALLHLNQHWLQHIQLPNIWLEAPHSLKQGREVAEGSFAAFDNNLRFNFSIPWFFDTELLQVRYKLHGLHERWIETDKREIMLQALGAGTYTLEIQVSFDPQFSSYESARYAFKIQKPFYLQWWFLGSLGILILLGSGWVIKSREERRRLRQEAEKQSIMAQYELLKSQISPHFLFNAFNTLSALIELDTRKAGAYVDQLAVLFRKVLHYKNIDSIPLAEEMELVHAYIYLQQQRFENRLHVHIDLEEESTKWAIIPMSIQLLVENAIKHNVISQSKPLYIHIVAKNQQVTVSNNLQPKSSPEPSSGFGLSALSSRYRQQYQADISISQTDSHFSVSLPLFTTQP